MDECKNMVEDKKIDLEMARCIKDIRNKAGMTAEELATKVNMTRNYISRLENGAIASPSFNTVYRIADVLSKTKVVKQSDIKLDNYKTPFAFLVKAYLTHQDVERQYIYKTANDDINFIMQNMEHLPEEWIALGRHLIEHHKHTKSIRNFCLAISRCNAKPQEFAMWLGNTYLDLVKVSPEVSGTIGETYSEVKNGAEEEMSGLVNYLLNSLSLYIVQTGCKEAEV